MLVLAATAVGGMLAVWSYSAREATAAATISMSVSPFHRGSLDVYVPLVDWGVRFGGVRAPARLKLEIEAIDRRHAADAARAGLPAIAPLRAQARNAVVSYLRQLALLAAAGALVLGLLVVAALRPRHPRRFGALVLCGSVAWILVIALLLAPRGELGSPQYYAQGADIPVALRAVEAASKSPAVLSEELDSQLLGLARLVTAPGSRPPLGGLPRLTVASDLHNNVVAIDAIKQAAQGGPLVLAGDLTDRGSPLESRAIAGIAGAGRPVIFVAGNHDSDTLARSLARRGVIVLTRQGRLRSDGSLGAVVTSVAGLRVAGFESPNMRTAGDGYVDHSATINDEDRAVFETWLVSLGDRVDVVVVHEPELAQRAVATLRRSPPSHPLLIIEGHTHQQALDMRDGATVVNGGTAGGGGTGNLSEGQPIGLAVVTFSRDPFRPVAADLVEVAPGTGGGTARRLRLDGGPVSLGDPDATSPETTTDVATQASTAIPTGPLSGESQPAGP